MSSRPISNWSDNAFARIACCTIVSSNAPRSRCKACSRRIRGRSLFNSTFLKTSSSRFCRTASRRCRADAALTAVYRRAASRRWEMISARCAAARTSLSAKVSGVVSTEPDSREPLKSFSVTASCKGATKVVRPMDDCSASVVRPCVVLETDGLALTPGLAISGSLLMVVFTLDSWMGSFVASWAHEWAAFCPLAAGEHMQRHQFCVAALSRNCAPGFIHEYLWPV